MEILKNIKSNTIIICENKSKNNILKELNKESKLLNIKIMSMNELIEKLTFSYDEKSIYKVSKKFNINSEIVKTYLEKIKYIEDKEYRSEKLKKLLSIKKYLEEENLLIKDEIFIESLNSKEIVIYNYKFLNKFEQKIIEKLKNKTSVKFINEETNDYIHVIYKFNTLEEEITYVVNEICKLILNGISINNIKLANINKDYYNCIKRIFNLFNIPVELKEKTSIYGTEVVKYFINNYEEDLDNLIENMKEVYPNNSIVIDIINICNKYYFIEDQNDKKEFIINDIKKTYLKNEKLINSVKEIDLLNDYIDDNDYIFLLNFNEGEIPISYKDEDYITDDIKNEIDIEDTNTLNKISKDKTISKIESIKNLTITYKLSSPYEKFYPSSLIKELKYEEETPIIDKNISYSKEYDKLNLSKYLDDFIKYGTYNNELEVLYNNLENINYGTYDNEYTPISKKSLKEYLDKKLVLSYSSVDNYYKCNFKYYLSNILKIDIFNENYYTFIGSLFHYILEKYYTEKIDIDEYIDKYIKKENIKLKPSEQFFLKKLIKELHFVINTIDEQIKYSKLNKILTEEKIVIEETYNDISVTFKGFVDKIMYKETSDKTIVALIDYKTGNTDIDLSLIPYGMSMQLPIYLYLAKNSKLKNIEFAGFYLQKILNSEIVKKDNKTYEEQKKDNLKLNGYSTTDEEILKEFDLTYKESNVIKGLKMKANQEFYKTSKVLSKEEINTLIDKIDEKIKEARTNILNAKFDINPKIIDGVNVSCKLCKFKDICYVKDKDKINLGKDKDLDYLKTKIN